MFVRIDGISKQLELSGYYNSFDLVISILKAAPCFDTPCIVYLYSTVDYAYAHSVVFTNVLYCFSILIVLNNRKRLRHRGHLKSAVNADRNSVLKSNTNLRLSNSVFIK